MKKLFIFIIICAVLISTIPVFASSQNVLYGDVNGDGVVDQADLQTLLEYDAGVSVPFFNFTAADLNGDGRISGVDILLLIKYLNGNITHFPVQGSNKFGLPLDTKGVCVVTANYKDPNYAGYGTHWGIDIAPQTNKNATYNILAVQSGTVTVSEFDNSGTGRGNYIRINHANGVVTTYMHLETRLVKVGDKVTTGTVIGYMGNSGASLGKHLHFGVRINSTNGINGTDVDPRTYITLPAKGVQF